MFAQLVRLFHAGRAVPADLRPTFRHLYWDIAWFGLTAGSSQAFLAVYVARLGADTVQLGLLSAGPAVVGLFFAMPAGLWLQRVHLGRAVFWAAVIGRANFLWWAFLPWLLPPQTQIWTYLVLVLLMAIPGTMVLVGFNAVYAAAVPPEWRTHVAGRRNALLALFFIVTSLVSGTILDCTPLTVGYPLVFFLGFVGVAMSTAQLWFLRDSTTAPAAAPVATSVADASCIRGSTGDLARPGDMRVMGFGLRTFIGLRAFTRGVNLLRPEVLAGRYGKIIAALFTFHFAQFMPLPILPLYWVEVLHFSDAEIGLGTATLHTALLLGSLQIARFTDRWGNRAATATGATLLALYPLLTAFTPNLTVFLMIAFLAGLSRSMVSGSLGNYLLENVPETERPPYLAWYNTALHAATLLGSLSGSLLAEHAGLMTGLLVGAGVSAFSGYAVWRWR